MGHDEARAQRWRGVEPLRLAGRDRLLEAALAGGDAPAGRRYRFAKRALDLALGAGLLVALAPALVLVALVIKLDSPGPVLFRQLRMGARERPFEMLKFRTMVVGAHDRLAAVAHLNVHGAADPRFFKAVDDPRTTRVGRLLRRLALDELPQLVNVLRGEMSLVGPRPLMLEEDCHVPADSRRRLTVRPGITGLWQVLGRNEIPFDEMLALDRLYATHCSLRLDLVLLARTPAAVLRTRRAY